MRWYDITWEFRTEGKPVGMKVLSPVSLVPFRSGDAFDVPQGVGLTEFARGKATLAFMLTLQFLISA